MFKNKTCDRLTIRFGDKSEYVLDQGIGLNWHHDWRADNAPRSSSPPVEDEERWRILMEELSFLSPNCIRFGYAAGKFVDEAGRINKNGDGFAVLKKLNDWARERQVSIFFDPWGIPRHYSFGKGADGVFYDAPGDIPAFVDGFIVPLIKYLVDERKLVSLTHFILLNEPLGSRTYLTPPGIDRYAHYVECYRSIFDAIQRNGFPIKLIGPDSWSTATWAVDCMNERNLDLAPSIDAFDQHCYYARFDYLPPNPTTASTLPMTSIIHDHVAKHARFARHKGKRYYITELGTFYYGWEQGDIFGGCTHEAFLTEAEFIIRAMQVGCGGFYRWAYLAPGEYADGVWQFINTVDNSYTRQPHTFHGYACLMRYTGRDAVVWPARVEPRTDIYEYVHAVGLQRPDKHFTILAVNNHNSQERIVRIELPDGWKGSWQKLLDDRTRKMLRNDLTPVNGVIEDVLPPMSLAVYTTVRLPDDNRIGINNYVSPCGGPQAF